MDNAVSRVVLLFSEILFYHRQKQYIFKYMYSKEQTYFWGGKFMFKFSNFLYIGTKRSKFCIKR